MDYLPIDVPVSLGLILWIGRHLGRRVTGQSLTLHQTFKHLLMHRRCVRVTSDKSLKLRPHLPVLFLTATWWTHPKTHKN